MAETWATLASYRLHDLLMFSATTYFRLFELINREWWPAPIVGALLALATLVAAWRRQAALGAVVLLALAWASVGWLFFGAAFADIHTLGSAWCGAFVLQALLWLAWAAAARPAHTEQRLQRALGLTWLLAAAAWPALAMAQQRPPWQAEVVGLAPDATVLLSLGLLLTRQCTRPWAAALLVVPLSWCLFSGATLWALNQPQAPALPLAGLVTAALLLVRSSR